MTQSTIQQNLLPNDPELKDLLDLYRKSILLGLNCHHIGTINSFNSATQTASVTINYKRTYFKPTVGTTSYVPNLADFPVALDCPVICLGGGDGALTFPIANGDECLVLFNDRDFDNWFNGNGSGAVATPRLHSFSDAIVLVGVRSLPNVLTSYSGSAVELRLGQNKISIASDSITANIGSSMSLVINAEGKLVITNLTGEFVAALITFLSTANAGGFPIVGNLTTLETFQG